MAPANVRMSGLILGPGGFTIGEANDILLFMNLNLNIEHPRMWGS